MSLESMISFSISGFNSYSATNKEKGTQSLWRNVIDQETEVQRLGVQVLSRIEEETLRREKENIKGTKIN